MGLKFQNGRPVATSNADGVIPQAQASVDNAVRAGHRGSGPQPLAKPGANVEKFSRNK